MKRGPDEAAVAGDLFGSEQELAEALRRPLGQAGRRTGRRTRAATAECRWRRRGRRPERARAIRGGDAGVWGCAMLRSLWPAGAGVHGWRKKLWDMNRGVVKSCAKKVPVGAEVSCRTDRKTGVRVAFASYNKPASPPPPESPSLHGPRIVPRPTHVPPGRRRRPAAGGDARPPRRLPPRRPERRRRLSPAARAAPTSTTPPSACAASACSTP